MDTHERPATSRRHARFVATVLAAFPLAAQAPPAAPKAAPDPTVGLPTFLLPVPGGQVTVGLTTEQAIDVASQSVSPDRPEQAVKLKEKLFVTRLSNISSELGQERRNVDTFLLGKWPVTNREYEIFLKQMAAIGVKVKPPFHWWRIGRKDDYDAKLEDINNQFKADGKWGPLKYWERYGVDLPYALKDDKGRPIDKKPVVNVAYRDAVRYAGWLGMRLPTELERTRAARGDTQNIWPWGGIEQVGDKYTAAVLKHMQLEKAGDQVLKDVGSVAFQNGPFGHFDMTGQVWEFTSVRGFDPICGPKAFELEWKRAQQDKVGALLVNSPAWKDKQYVVVKGASYFSSQDPIQFHIDCRDKVMTDDVLDAVGFRLAKSLKPGYDLLVSLISSDYNMELFELGKEDQGVAFAAQIGLERYVLDAEGFPLEYHAVSIAPVTWISAEKNQTVPKLEERSHNTPVLLGTMATTEAMLEPKLAPGIYSVAYRQKGMPKELKEAIKAGHKEVQAALKKGADAGEATPAAPEAEGDAPKKKADWRSVIARYGITEKDLEPKDAHSLEFVRLGTYQVPTDADVILFFDNQGKWVGHVKGSLSAGNLAPNELILGTGKVDKVDHLKIELKVRVPVLKDQKKGAEYTFDLLLEQGPPAAGVTWRMPVENGNGAAGGSNNRIVISPTPPKPDSPDPPKSDLPTPPKPKK